MPLTTAERNAAADFIAGRLSFVSLHTADPGATGANEGSTARKAVSYAAASGGTATGPAVPVDVPAGTYRFVGYWSALSGGTFRGGHPLPVEVTLSGAGQIQVTPSIPLT